MQQLSILSDLGSKPQKTPSYKPQDHYRAVAITPSSKTKKVPIG